MKQKNFNLPRNKKVTVDDLLSQSEVNEILKYVTDKKPEIDSLIVIFDDKKGCLHLRHTDDSDIWILGMIEVVKSWITDITDREYDEEA